MLTIVYRQSIPIDSPGAAAKLAGGFEQSDRNALTSKLNGASNTRPAAADDGNLV
jgi:hypothetical protein